MVDEWGTHEHLSDQMARRQSQHQTDDHACEEGRTGSSASDSSHIGTSRRWPAVEFEPGRDEDELTCEDGDDRLVHGSDPADLQIVRHPQRTNQEHTQDAQRPGRVRLLLLGSRNRIRRTRRHRSQQRRVRPTGARDGGRGEDDDARTRVRGDGRPCEIACLTRYARRGVCAGRWMVVSGPRKGGNAS